MDHYSKISKHNKNFGIPSNNFGYRTSPKNNRKHLENKEDKTHKNDEYGSDEIFNSLESTKYYFEKPIEVTMERIRIVHK